MRYVVLAFLCVIATVAYIQRAAISVPLREIGADLRLEKADYYLGLVQSGWYLGYAIFQIPSGWVADRIGGRRGLMMYAVLWSLATAAAGFAPTYVALLCSWTAMGALQAGIFPCAVKTVGQVFTEAQRARASGLLSFGMLAGGAIAPVLTASLLQSLDATADRLDVDRWRLCLFLYAIPGLAWAVAYGFGTMKLGLDDNQQAKASSPVDWGRLVTSKPLILLCAQQFLRAAAMVFFMTWFPTFLRETRGVSLLQSGLLTTCAGLAGMIGSVNGGFFSDWLLFRTGNRRLSRQGIAVVGMTCCAILISVSYFIADVKAAIAVISLGVFCATFGGVSGYTVAIDFGGRRVATVFSVMNMCGSLGGMLFPFTVGALVSRTGNWDLALFLFAGLMAVDAVCWALLNPKGTLFDDDVEVLATQPA